MRDIKIKHCSAVHTFMFEVRGENDDNNYFIVFKSAVIFIVGNDQFFLSVIRASTT